MGCSPSAKAIEWCAAGLEEVQRTWDLEELTLGEAQEVSGFSYSALEKMVRRGYLQNVNKKGSPRVRRGDLPRKPSKRRLLDDSSEPDLAQEVLISRLDG